ncbi:MAG: hypothetical protein KAR19_06100 [Bacteroidales bacterium]|nr:hypothetical protein [Bacteroidales bacterium]
MIILVLVVLGGNQVIIGLFSRFSDKLILENHEDIRASIDNADRKLDDCREVLSLVHKKDVWEKIEFMFRSMKENVNLLVNSQPENGVLQHIISHQIFDLITKVESLINETAQEIGEYEIMNRKIKVHGTITVDVIGTLLILLLAIGSFKFIRGYPTD